MLSKPAVLYWTLFQNHNIRNINFVLPQGTVLGPIFFMYVNDLLEINIGNLSSSLYSYAVIFSDHDSNYTLGNADIIMNIIEEWLDKNLPFLNV